MQKNIKVGIFDWVQFPQENNFYPEDLPQDWRLSYFSNEFETACIDLASPSLHPDLLTEWVDELPDSFELCFVLSRLSHLEQLTELVDQVAVKINYLIVNSQQQNNAFINDVFESVQDWKYRPQQVISVLSLWTPETPLKPSNIALMPAVDDMRLYREWIELWLEENNQQELSLWLDGDSATYSTLGQLRTLVELMGY